MTTTTTVPEEVRLMVRGAYAQQKLRIQTGNRLVANFKVKLGVEPGEKDKDALDKEDQRLLTQLTTAYGRVTDGITKFPTKRAFKSHGVISTYAELCLVDQYIQLLMSEKKQFEQMKGIIHETPLWKHYLKDVCGVGEAMAGVIMSEIDIHKAKYPSSLWMYAGLDVAPDGKGRSRRKEHLVDREYVDVNGDTQTRKSTTFKPFLKAKLLGVLAGSFLMQKSRKGNQYYGVYEGYKHRLEHHKMYKDVSKGHRHAMAVRYMVKMFLIDLYNNWRRIEGLEVAPPYHEAKLGMKPHGEVAA